MGAKCWAIKKLSHRPNCFGQQAIFKTFEVAGQVMAPERFYPIFWLPKQPNWRVKLKRVKKNSRFAALNERGLEMGKLVL